MGLGDMCPCQARPAAGGHAVAGEWADAATEPVGRPPALDEGGEGDRDMRTHGARAAAGERAGDRSEGIIRLAAGGQ
jgi:hypothetical protein